MLKRFIGQNSCRFYHEQLSVLRQRSNEPSDAFADRVRKLNMNTYELTENNEANRIILQEAENGVMDAYLRGLQPEMSRRVRAEFPKTLNEAVNIAVAMNVIREVFFIIMLVPIDVV